MLKRLRRLLNPPDAPIDRSAELDRSIQAQCRESIDAFQKITPIDWAPRTILPSEGFMVLTLCDLYGIDTIIESGVYDGRSASIWAAWRDRKLRVIAIDRELRDEARQALMPYPNVELVEGNGKKLAKQYIEQAASDGRKVAVFIDGPKGPLAVEMARKCMRNRCVRFAGVYDVHRLTKGLPNESRTVMEESGGTLFTDEQWFYERYGELDQAEGQHADTGQQGMRWQPHKYTFDEGLPDKILGSYGPTIGFMLKAPPR
jgi:hypothetical protein